MVQAFSVKDHRLSEEAKKSKSTVINKLIEEGINGNLHCLSVKPVVLSPKECSLSYAPEGEKLPLGVDLLDTVLITIPKNQIELVAWRIPIVVSAELPTGRVLAAAAHSAALFCCQAQAHNLVPMIDLQLKIIDYSISQARILLPEQGASAKSFASEQFCPLSQFSRAPRRWRSTCPNYFKLSTDPSTTASPESGDEIQVASADEEALCQSLAEEIGAIIARILASMTEMSVDFKDLVIGIGVDVEANGDLVRNGRLESVLVAKLAEYSTLVDLGALCLILPPCQDSSQKNLVEIARSVSPYPVLFTQLRESLYSKTELGISPSGISSYQPIAPEKIMNSSEADSLLTAGC